MWRSPDFIREWNEFSLEQASCVSLLNAMELEGSNGEETEPQTEQMGNQADDEELSNLPLEWVENWATQRKNQSKSDLLSSQQCLIEAENCITEEEEEIQNTQPSSEDVEKLLDQADLAEKPRQAKKQVWGPILGQR